MLQHIYRFWSEDEGQDLIEYSLLIAFIALACFWLFGSGQGAINQIWGVGSTRLSTASTAIVAGS